MNPKYDLKTLRSKISLYSANKIAILITVIVVGIMFIFLMSVIWPDNAGVQLQGRIHNITVDIIVNFSTEDGLCTVENAQLQRFIKMHRIKNIKEAIFPIMKKDGVCRLKEYHTFVEMTVSVLFGSCMFFILLFLLYFLIMNYLKEYRYQKRVIDIERHNLAEIERRNLIAQTIV
jgi:hypothetical protein